MNVPLKIVLFTLAVTGFYTYVGAIVPQMEAHPPKSTEIGADMGPVELAATGKEIFFGKGTCALCHTIGGKGERCPDLEGIGRRAASRIEGVSAQEYLAQSMYQPNEYVVDGYQPTMPNISRAPIGLTDGEIIAVVAFLQNEGGEITVTPATRFEAAGEAGSQPVARTEGEGPLDALAIIKKYNCEACHDLAGAERRLGPPLHDIGARQTRAQILHSIVEPDAEIAAGEPPYTPGLMSATLMSTGFYDTLTLPELTALVEHLASLEGGE
ncbi:MAG: c-type cytochrome [Myxococcota bacterium]|jgi:cytochrome c2|nr:c-type cytochrome [Myxococcota bacterium]